jgi:hypothetical protein
MDTSALLTIPERITFTPHQCFYGFDSESRPAFSV